MGSIRTIAWLLLASACGRVGFAPAPEDTADAPTSGLIGHWTLDEPSGTTVADSSGTQDGTWHGEPVLRATAGVIGGALEFDGADDYVDIGDHPSFDLTGPITIAAWIYVDNTSSQKVILDKKLDGGAHGYRFLAFWTTLRFTFSDGITTQIHVYAPEGILQPGRWYHAAVTYDLANVRMYLDGIEVSQEPHAEPIVPNQLPLRIANYASDSYWFDGKIDDVRLYDRALSPDEVSALHGPPGGTF